MVQLLNSTRAALCFKIQCFNNLMSLERLQDYTVSITDFQGGIPYCLFQICTNSYTINFHNQYIKGKQRLVEPFFLSSLSTSAVAELIACKNFQACGYPRSSAAHLYSRQQIFRYTLLLWWHLHSNCNQDLDHQLPTVWTVAAQIFKISTNN